MPKPIRPTELPRYVGYAEIEEATGIDKRQIQRLMVLGKFPRPDGIPTKENRWRLTVILEWLEARNAREIADLQKLARSDPSKLKPEDLTDAAFNFAAELMTRAGGTPVSPQEAVIGRFATQAERAALIDAQVRALEECAQAMAGFDRDRAMLIVNWLFPAIGELFRGPNGKGLPTGDLAREMGRIAMNEAAWAEIKNKLAK